MHTPSCNQNAHSAIILEGKINVHVADKVIPLGQGAIIGEMSYFEGGYRMADVYAGIPAHQKHICTEDVFIVAYICMYA